MDLVVNEWLLDYLRPDASQDERRIAVRFLECFNARSYKMVIRIPSPFVSKFYKNMKRFENDRSYKDLSKKLFELFFVNSEKTEIIRDQDMRPIPPELAEGVSVGDYYLIQSAYSSTERIIITTDQPLRDSLQNRSEIRFFSPEEFLNEHC